MLKNKKYKYALLFLLAKRFLKEEFLFEYSDEEEFISIAFSKELREFTITKKSDSTEEIIPLSCLEGVFTSNTRIGEDEDEVDGTESQQQISHDAIELLAKIARKYCFEKNNERYDIEVGNKIYVVTATDLEELVDTNFAIIKKLEEVAAKFFGDNWEKKDILHYTDAKGELIFKILTTSEKREFTIRNQKYSYELTLDDSIPDLVISPTLDQNINREYLLDNFLKIDEFNSGFFESDDNDASSENGIKILNLFLGSKVGVPDDGIKILNLFVEGNEKLKGLLLTLNNIRIGKEGVLSKEEKGILGKIGREFLLDIMNRPYVKGYEVNLEDGILRIDDGEGINQMFKLTKSIFFKSNSGNENSGNDKVITEADESLFKVILDTHKMNLSASEIQRFFRGRKNSIPPKLRDQNLENGIEMLLLILSCYDEKNKTDFGNKLEAEIENLKAEIEDPSKKIGAQKTLSEYAEKGREFLLEILNYNKTLYTDLIRKGDTFGIKDEESNDQKLKFKLTKSELLRLNNKNNKGDTRITEEDKKLFLGIIDTYYRKRREDQSLQNGAEIQRRLFRSIINRKLLIEDTIEGGLILNSKNAGEGGRKILLYILNGRSYANVSFKNNILKIDNKKEYQEEFILTKHEFLKLNNLELNNLNNLKLGDLDNGKITEKDADLFEGIINTCTMHPIDEFSGIATKINETSGNSTTSNNSTSNNSTLTGLGSVPALGPVPVPVPGLGSVPNVAPLATTDHPIFKFFDIATTSNNSTSNNSTLTGLGSVPVPVPVPRSDNNLTNIINKNLEALFKDPLERKINEINDNSKTLNTYEALLQLPEVIPDKDNSEGAEGVMKVTEFIVEHNKSAIEYNKSAIEYNKELVERTIKYDESNIPIYDDTSWFNSKKLMRVLFKIKDLAEEKEALFLDLNKSQVSESEKDETTGEAAQNHVRERLKLFYNLTIGDIAVLDKLDDIKRKFGKGEVKSERKNLSAILDYLTSHLNKAEIFADFLEEGKLDGNKIKKSSISTSFSSTSSTSIPNTKVKVTKINELAFKKNGNTIG